MDYLTFILSYNLWDTWAIFLLGLGRLVTAISMAPFFGAKLLPASVKIGFGVALSFIFLPFLIVQNTSHYQFDILFSLLMIKEILIGFVLGFLISIPFQFVQSAGAIIDHQRGASSLQVMNPALGAQTSPLGTLNNNMMIVIFFTIGGPLLFFQGLLTSFSVLPIHEFLPPAFFSHDAPLYILIMRTLHEMLRVMIQLAAPSLLAMLLSDLFLGIVNRMAPQVQISFLLWSLKAFLGIAFVWLAWFYILKQMDVEAKNWLKDFATVARHLAGAP
ncbi:MAG: hypothetical protein S4CHLAM81_15130 [Chlamydiales bacterium]|nr:hypothetical protein [Chlamydiales bacterium]MCH9636282.1 hypothetical protein [Chlamydiales bacterium]MCH9703161.1 flagellar biosynthetic protein FliR [Chlamydiota bacterium]